MGCETKGDWEDIWELGSVSPKVAKVANDILIRIRIPSCPIVNDTVFLHYVFWPFGSCIDGFKYCKSVINIDGTHLYGKFQGKLLVAMETDANVRTCGTC